MTPDFSADTHPSFGRLSRAALFVSLFAVSQLGLEQAVGQTPTATITYPVNGAVEADLTPPIQWASVPNVEAYYLYVGSVIGGKDIVNTGEMGQTSYQAWNLPLHQTLHARLWTKASGVWRFADTTFSASATASLAATIVEPPNGAANADASQPIRWESAPNSEAYYLYVGSTVGARDLIDTGEIQLTSSPASTLPAGQAVFARLWTKTAGVWRYTDSSFSVTTLLPAFTYPPPGSTSVDDGREWTWTTVPNAQAYYLYVGTTAGAKDLVNTGEIQQTSYLPTNLPVGSTIYARLWAKVSGIWRHVDASASIAPVARLTVPAADTTDNDLTQPMRWTAVTGAQAYYLYVGSTPGAKDLVDTGETGATSYMPSGNLPANQVLYARLWTKADGIWRYTDSTFTFAATIAQFIYPADGSSNIDTTRRFTWTPIAGAQAYLVQLGTSVGANDIADSGEIGETSLRFYWNLPIGPLLYARLWTKGSDAVWRFTDISFTAARAAAGFMEPTDGESDFDPTRPITWTPVAGADSYLLQIGRAPGTGDLVNTGEIAGTSFVAVGLPTSTPLYARVWTRHDDVWRYEDAVFGVGSHEMLSMIAPADGETSFDGGTPFDWTPLALARGYRLQIGTQAGASDVHDSGEIELTRRFVRDLPVGVPLFGRLSARLDGVWQAIDFSFVAASSQPSIDAEIESALFLTDLVRRSADDRNGVFTWTELWQGLRRYNKTSAFCLDYAETLLALLTVDLNVSSQVRKLTTSFQSNGYDTHQLVELHDARSDRWLVLDPTFDLVPTRSADGELATADEVSQAAATQSWGVLSFRALGTMGDQYARDYYLDYPLLYLNVYHGGAGYQAGQGRSPLPYLDLVSLPVAGTRDVYVLGCATQTSALVTIDGVATSLDCSGVDGLSTAFYASAISIESGAGGVRAYQVRRFVF